MKTETALKTDKEVIVTIGAGYTTTIVSGNHTLLADEPVAIGGANLGPDPYALLLASLGACTVITLRMYADRKQMPLESVELRLSHLRNHASDCADCDAKDVRIDVIRKKLILHGPLTDEQKQRLRQISDRCPVQKTLEKGVRVESY